MDLSTLNKEQRQAVETLDGRCLYWREQAPARPVR